ncbi:MAG TPA: Ig-like domain-containing protein [Verrucomicrobiae bacterium]|nr:Ig-like domain-containing protein [Verrucomicrobiae bacterium]
MKSFRFFGQFSLLGVALSLLLISTFVSRAQTGPPVPAFEVTITTPTNGEAFPIGAEVLISATAKDANGFINTMSFYSGTNRLAAWVIDPIFPIPTNDTLTLSYDWTNVPPGAYTLTAVAGDNHGLSVTSAPVNITVGLKPPPIVTIIATDPIAVEPGTNTNHIIITPLASAASAYPSFTNYCTGTNTATFLVRRISGIISPLVPAEPLPTNDLTVYYTISGTASNGVDYETLPGYVTIPAYKNYALITVNPLEDNDASNSPPFSTVILTLVPPPTLNPGSAEPYRIHWPDKAGAIILEEYLFPFGPPIGPCGPPLAGTAFAPFHGCFPATNGMPYCLEVSSNLTAWTPVCTNLVLKNCIQFVDPDACNLSNCYYRVVRPTAVPVY